MKLKNGLLVAVALAIFVGGGIASAKPPRRGPPPDRPPADPPGLVKAPELDATAGIQAIALLSGVLLLLGESARRRKV